MSKKGFTLMELLVSIFITGMVMLSLVAMWRTSSNHTAQAQRQSVIKNDNTIFLRTFYNDFVAASEVLCPGARTLSVCNGKFISLKDAVLDPEDPDKIIRLTGPVCGTNGTEWGNGTDLEGEIESRCVQPSFIVYKVQNNTLFKCRRDFTDSAMSITGTNSLDSKISDECADGSENWEAILYYVNSFDISTDIDSSGNPYPELKLDYNIRKDFVGDIPPVLFKLKRIFVRKKGL